jgi:hypothetical protein
MIQDPGLRRRELQNFASSSFGFDGACKGAKQLEDLFGRDSMSAVTAYQEYYVLKTIHKTVISIQTNSSIPHYASTPGSLTPWLLGFSPLRNPLQLRKELLVRRSEPFLTKKVQSFT